jgi:hypothetical protein
MFETIGGVVIGGLILIFLVGILMEYGSKIAGGLLEVVIWIVVFGIAYLVFGIACLGARDVWRFFVPRYIDSESAHMIANPIFFVLTFCGFWYFVIDSLVLDFRWTKRAFRSVKKAIQRENKDSKRIQPIDR